MGKKQRKRNDKDIAKLALVTALLSLVTQIITLTRTLIEWLTNP